MKNIGASVSEVLTHEKKEKVEEEIEEEIEEEYHQMENEMIFFLAEAPEYHISAVGKWCENTAGKVIGDVDTYFLHKMTGQRCECAWSCLIGWSEQDEKTIDMWTTLCRRIGEIENLEETICDEKSVEL